MGQAIMITSGKGGSGKSTLAVALGRCLSEAGKSVVLIDMDMGMRSLDIMLSMQDKVVYDLADVVEGVCRLRQALVRVLPGRELFLLNAAQTRGSEAVSPAQIEAVSRKLKQRFDYVLLDCPAGVGRGFRNAASGADNAILCVLPDRVSVRDAERVVGLLQRCDIANPKLVINRVSMNAPPGEGLSAWDIEHTLGLKLLGWVPEDAALRMDRLERTEAFQAMRRIARRLEGEQLPIPAHKPHGLFARLRRAARAR